MADSQATARNHWQSAMSVLTSRNNAYAVKQAAQAHPLAFADGALTLGVPDLFFRDFLDHHYGALLSDVLGEVAGGPVRLEFQVVPGLKPSLALQEGPAVNSQRVPTRLTERFTFDTYVVSDSNQLPHAAAMAVADQPGRAYNPLFIYGGTGLGKTHLLHAIGNRVLARNPQARVQYVSTEDFTNQYIEAVRNNRMADFRRRFREECDVLLIDDIQFLGSKQQTQDEFFHTFNALHQLSRAVVMTSDKVPSEIPGLEDRLRSRFAQGLITDVNEPTFEARVAILKKKALADGVHLTDVVAQFIARNVVRNVRELEGALIKVVAMHTLTRQPLTEEFCAQVLKDVIPAAQALDTDTIQKEVARYYRLSVEELKGERRVKNIAHARQVAMYLARSITRASFPDIGKKFNRDHSTVIASVEKIEAARRGNDAQLELELGELSAKLGQG